MVTPGPDVADSQDNVALRASLKRCMMLLLSKGALLPREGVPDAEQEIVRTVIQDVVTLALVPSHTPSSWSGLDTSCWLSADLADLVYHNHHGTYSWDSRHSIWSSMSRCFPPHHILEMMMRLEAAEADWAGEAVGSS